MTSNHPTMIMSSIACQLIKSFSQQSYCFHLHIDMSITQHAQLFEEVCVGELCALIKEGEQIVSVRLETHNPRLLCIDSDFLCAYTLSFQQVVQLCMHMVTDGTVPATIADMPYRG